MPNWDEIRREWESTDISFKDLAAKHDIKDSTIRSRKNREKWQRNATPNNAMQRRNVATKKQEPKHNKKSVVNVSDENDELTDKQRLFISYYLKYWNATKAYQKAYGCDYATANVNGSRLLVKASISEEVKKTRDEIFSDSFLSTQAIIQKYMDIAFADITEFMEFGSIEETARDMFGKIIKDPETGEPITYIKNFVHFVDSEKIDGTIISEVKQGKDGASIKLADRMRALDKLDKYMGLMSEDERLKVQKLQAEVALLNQKANKDVDKPIEIVITRKGERS